jgi:hypothetical protein
MLDYSIVSHRGEHVPELESARNAHERDRKHFKETWMAYLKTLETAGQSLQKAKAKYEQTAAEWEKTLVGRRKEEESTYKLKLDKRNKEEGEAKAKLEEARRAYDHAVQTANEALNAIKSLRDELNVKLTQSLFAGGETLRTVLLRYHEERHRALASNDVEVKELIENLQVGWRREGRGEAKGEIIPGLTIDLLSPPTDVQDRARCTKVSGAGRGRGGVRAGGVP